MSDIGDGERRLRESYVLPFYMQLPTHSAELVPSVAATGREAPLADILELLGSDWRPRQVGAWFAIVRDEPEVLPAVLESLRTSRGSLTAPELAVAAIVLCGEEAIPALLDYQTAETERNFGRCGEISAARELLGARSPLGPASDEERARFARYLRVATDLQSADTTVKWSTRATITQLPAFQDHPPYGLGTRTTSFLVVVPGAEIGVGCIITPAVGSPAVPGDLGIEVTIEFWDASVIETLEPGTEFSLKCGQLLGAGRVTA
jgi:hypothetical protein